jgi:UDP-glucose 6-dehydrogenase
MRWSSIFRTLLGGAKNISIVNIPMNALVGANALIVVTEWKAFRSPDFDVILQKLTRPIIFMDIICMSQKQCNGWVLNTTALGDIIGIDCIEF